MEQLEKVLCIEYDEWVQHRKETQETSRKVDEMRLVLGKILGHTEHLSKLDVIATAIVDMKEHLISAVVGKDHVPTKTHDLMFAQMARVNSFNYKVLAAVSLGLLVIIVFLLTGETLGWINPLH